MIVKQRETSCRLAAEASDDRRSVRRYTWRKRCRGNRRRFTDRDKRIHALHNRGERKQSIDGAKGVVRVEHFDVGWRLRVCMTLLRDLLIDGDMADVLVCDVAVCMGMKLTGGDARCDDGDRQHHGCQAASRTLEQRVEAAAKSNDHARKIPDPGSAAQGTTGERCGAAGLHFWASRA